MSNVNHCKVFRETLLGWDFIIHVLYMRKPCQGTERLRNFLQATQLVSGDLEKLFVELTGQEEGSVSRAALGIHYNVRWSSAS